MAAKIIGQNHVVTPYQVNGRKRYIVDEIAITNNRAIVNLAIELCGSREWATVYNYLDGQGALPDPKLENTIERMTY